MPVKLLAEVQMISTMYCLAKLMMMSICTQCAPMHVYDDKATHRTDESARVLLEATNVGQIDTFLNTHQIHAVEALNMRLEWPVYAFTARVFLSFALSVQFLSLGIGAVVGLFVLLTVAYAWVAWVMIKQKAVLELHAYMTCPTCDELTPSQGKHCMNCGAEL